MVGGVWLPPPLPRVLCEAVPAGAGRGAPQEHPRRQGGHAAPPARLPRLPRLRRGRHPRRGGASLWHNLSYTLYTVHLHLQRTGQRIRLRRKRGSRVRQRAAAAEGREGVHARRAAVAGVVHASPTRCAAALAGGGARRTLEAEACADLDANHREEGLPEEPLDDEERHQPDDGRARVPSLGVVAESFSREGKQERAPRVRQGAGTATGKVCGARARRG